MSLWRTVRSCFPVADAWVHLDHARMAPASSRVDESLRGLLFDATRLPADDATARYAAEVERVRDRVARLLGADAGETAFVDHAARALALAVADVDWRRGDRLLAVGESLVLPESALSAAGVDLMHVPLHAGAFSLARIEEALRHPRVRLLVTPAVEPGAGARAPLSAIAELCAERGVLLAVEASHHAGVLALDLRGDGLDYVAADAHRFLLGLPGTAVLLRNARTAPGPGSAAERFEPAGGAGNALGVAALGAGVDLLHELAPSAVEKHVLALTDRLVDGLAERGIDPLVPRSAARSAIVTFRVGEETPARSAERLRARRIAVSALDRGVRVSPHAWTTPGDSDALLEAL
ncbi:MAG: aminotransferase class V-fold PLP-dependent enzyme [Myxococcota bacterium]